MFIVKNAINKVLPGLAKCQQKGITDMNDILCNDADKTRTNWGVMTVKYYLMTKKKNTPLPQPSQSSSLIKKKKKSQMQRKKKTQTNIKTQRHENTQSNYNTLVYSLATFWLSCGSAPFSVCEPLWCKPS